MLGKISIYRFVVLVISVSHNIGYGQILDCPELSMPSDGATDVSVNTNLEWNGVIGATAYTLRIGTSSGADDIISDQNVGNITMLNLEANLPPLSDIYISIFPSDGLGTNMTCMEYQFSTGMTEVPRCTEIIDPRDGNVLVPVNNNVTWVRDFIATGYLMTIREGDPNGVLILDNEPVGNGTNYKPPNFKPRTLYYLTITPFNDAGPAENCQAISFTTGDPLPLPDCAQVIAPGNDQIEVPVDTDISWNSVDGAEGYVISVGTSINGGDIIDNQDTGTNTSFTLPEELPMGTRIYVKVASYKDGEMSESCSSHSFVTKSPEIAQSEEFIPKFFTPNSDGVNDEWRINPPQNISVLQIHVFDRFGFLLKQLQPFQGWDGTFNGRLLPSGSYWYSVQLADAPQIRGFFALKR